MNKDSKVKWVEALRSGRYEQARNQLRTPNDKFCCLGVLADVVAPEGWEAPTAEGDSWLHYSMGGDLSVKVAERVALDARSEQHLVDMNDVHLASFAQIADYIEREL